MQPSSLVFVVVIAIWAAYLVQYWVRRREHMSTARSVDRFSRAMRVLDRRSADAQPDTEAAPAVRPSLVARPTARPVQAEVPAAPAGMPSAPAGRGVAPRRGRRLGRLLRAGALLLALALVPVTAVLAVLGFAPRWSLALALGLVALCLVALRLVAVREQTARHTERSMRSARPRQPRVASQAGAPALGEDADAVPSDIEAVAVAEAPPARPAAAPAYRPGDPTWQPVPVPRPTYQLKDAAPPARPAPTQAPRPAAERQPEHDQAARPPRRRVVGG